MPVSGQIIRLAGLALRASTFSADSSPGACFFLLATPAEALSEGWERWELPEQVFAAGRQLGLKLTTAEVRRVITAAGA